MYVGLDENSTKNSMDEKTFNAVLDRIESIYTPIISRLGKKFKIVRLWKNSIVAARARRYGNIWEITISGGLARHAKAAIDAFVIIACHELAHHIGGAPKDPSSSESTKWSSIEGQADYFATSKCMRKYMQSDDNQAIMEGIKVPPLVIQKCKDSFGSAEQIAMCKRSSLASLAAIRRLIKNPGSVAFTTPDKSVVAKTYYHHPSGQCRLDTLFAGSLCNKDAYFDPSQSDAKVGFCNRSDGYKIGVRPQCWYKPTN